MYIGTCVTICSLEVMWTENLKGCLHGRSALPVDPARWSARTESAEIEVSPQIFFSGRRNVRICRSIDFVDDVGRADELSADSLQLVEGS